MSARRSNIGLWTGWGGEGGRVPTSARAPRSAFPRASPRGRLFVLRGARRQPADGLSVRRGASRRSVPVACQGVEPWRDSFARPPPVASRAARSGATGSVHAAEPLPCAQRQPVGPAPEPFRTGLDEPGAGWGLCGALAGRSPGGDGASRHSHLRRDSRRARRHPGVLAHAPGSWQHAGPQCHGQREHRQLLACADGDPIGGFPLSALSVRQGCRVLEVSDGSPRQGAPGAVIRRWGRALHRPRGLR